MHGLGSDLCVQSDAGHSTLYGLAIPVMTLLVTTAIPPGAIEHNPRSTFLSRRYHGRQCRLCSRLHRVQYNQREAVITQITASKDIRRM